MKIIKLLGIVISLFVLTSVQAQVSVGVNVGTPPPWGPVSTTEVRYYYLPDIEAYYDIQTVTFIYFERGRWIRSVNLPLRYWNYDLYMGYKVLLPGYFGSSPHSFHQYHRAIFGKGFRGHPQKTYGKRPDSYHSIGRSVPGGDGHSRSKNITGEDFKNKGRGSSVGSRNDKERRNKGGGRGIR